MREKFKIIYIIQKKKKCVSRIVLRLRNFVTFESNYVAETSVHQLHCHVQHVMSRIGHPNQWRLQLISLAIILLYTTSSQQHSRSIVLFYIMSADLLFIIIIRFADVY